MHGSVVWHNLFDVKIPMRVIPEPSESSRYVMEAEGHPGAQVIARGQDSRTYLCGGCRAILARGVNPDAEIVHKEDPVTGDFVPLYRVRDIVFKCKSCGAFNEVS